MKWIKDRQRFLNEAKIRDVILPRQAKKVSRTWGEKYLDYEEVDPTDKIKQGKWKLSEEDKNKVLGSFFGSYDGPIDMDAIFEKFEKLPEKFVSALTESIDLESLDEKFKIIFENFNPKKPTIDQISALYDPVFRKLSVSDTKATSMIQKDENGRPIKDEEGNMLRIEKEAGEAVFEKNLVNIKGFVQSYSRCYEEMDYNIFYTSDISNLISLSKENHNSEYKIDFEIFNRDLYLSINHNAKDILNMSISTFYSSCQHLYSDSGYNRHLLSNVFDPNSIPAFLIFDTPIYWDDEKISDFLPLSRLMVRNVESFDDSGESNIYLDKAYPDRMQDEFEKVIEKYSNNINTHERGDYLFTPDIDPNDDLKSPYMDRLGMRSSVYIGVNTKSLYLNRNHDWSKVKISPKAKIKEMVIETEDLPSNISELNLNPDWVKFKMMKISNLEPFQNVKTDSIAFDKCKLDGETFESISDVKKLQLISCDLKSGLDLSKFNNLEELQLIFTLDNLEQLKETLDKVSIKKLVVSGDLFSTKESKNYLKELKSKFKIEIVGPII